MLQVERTPPRADDAPAHVPVLIVGGGITGLSAAWHTQQTGTPYAVIEQSARWGGKLQTETVETEAGTFVIEAGPDSFITQKPWGVQLARKIGMGDELLGTNDDRRETYILNRGRLTPLPDGLLMIVPTRFMPFALSPLISPLGKLRMAMEPFLPVKGADEDESLAEFVRRRLGQEALDKLAEPLMSGIYNTDAEAQSLLATFPRFRALEQKYGSLTRGMIAGRKSAPPSKGPKPSLFTSLKGGMESFVDRLVGTLTGDLRLGTGVEAITPLDDGSYTVALSDGTVMLADHIIMTTPAPTAANLLGDIAPDAAAILNDIEYVGTGTVSLAYPLSDIPRPLNGFGVVIPRSEQRRINAITWSSTKFDHRAPEGYGLLRVFFGGSRTPASMKLDDETLMATVKDEMRQIMGITAEPMLTRIFRYAVATPQYAVGHLQRMDALDAVLPPGVFVAGAAFRGIGVPDCIHQGELIVEKLALETP